MNLKNDFTDDANAEKIKQIGAKYEEVRAELNIAQKFCQNLSEKGAVMRPHIDTKISAPPLL